MARLEELPTAVDTTAASATVSFPSPYPGIRSQIDALLAADDLDGLVRLVPVRDTALRGWVASALRFQCAADYETAARVGTGKDRALAAEVRVLVGPMPS